MRPLISLAFKRKHLGLCVATFLSLGSAQHAGALPKADNEPRVGRDEPKAQAPGGAANRSGASATPASPSAGQNTNLLPAGKYRYLATVNGKHVGSDVTIVRNGAQVTITGASGETMSGSISANGSLTVTGQHQGTNVTFTAPVNGANANGTVNVRTASKTMNGSFTLSPLSSTTSANNKQPAISGKPAIIGFREYGGGEHAEFCFYYCFSLY